MSSSRVGSIKLVHPRISYPYSSRATDKWCVDSLHELGSNTCTPRQTILYRFLECIAKHDLICSEVFQEFACILLRQRQPISLVSSISSSSETEQLTFDNNPIRHPSSSILPEILAPVPFFMVPSIILDKDPDVPFEPWGGDGGWGGRVDGDGGRGRVT